MNSNDITRINTVTAAVVAAIEAYEGANTVRSASLYDTVIALIGKPLTTPDEKGMYPEIAALGDKALSTIRREIIQQTGWDAATATPTMGTTATRSVRSLDVLSKVLRSWASKDSVATRRKHLALWLHSEKQAIDVASQAKPAPVPFRVVAAPAQAQEDDDIGFGPVAPATPVGASRGSADGLAEKSVEELQAIFAETFGRPTDRTSKHNLLYQIRKARKVIANGGDPKATKRPARVATIAINLDDAQSLADMMIVARTGSVPAEPVALGARLLAFLAANGRTQGVATPQASAAPAPSQAAPATSRKDRVNAIAARAVRRPNR